MGLCPAEHGAVSSGHGACPAQHGAVLSEHGAVSRMVSPGTKDTVVEASIAHHGAVPSGHGGVVRVLQVHLL